jgi:glycosyltransferase involved in cell wall biosynthesis
VKVLLVTMYFPPAGGAGVQRPLKLAAHLADLGLEVHVLAPDDPKWLYRDDSLVVPPNVTVHRVRNVGPRARLRADELHGAGRFDRLGVRATTTFRRVLVPDASVLWHVTAGPAAIRLVRKLGIDVVVTTSPPISVNLTGLSAKRWAHVPWVADLRDSFVSPDRRRHIRGEKWLARRVARRADAIVAATHGIEDEIRALNPRGRVTTIENGCDYDDFDGLEYRRGDRFRLTHTGSFVSRRNARPFFEALARAANGDTRARFVGGLRAADAPYVESLGLGDRLEVVPFRPHDEVSKLQRDSDVNLLLLAAAGDAGRKILSAKVFEYLAAGRPILAVVPPDGEAADLVRETGAGPVVAPDDVDGIAAALTDLEARWRDNILEPVLLTDETRASLSRRERAERFAALLEQVVQ